jgi:Matrixin
MRHTGRGYLTLTPEQLQPRFVRRIAPLLLTLIAVGASMPASHALAQAPPSDAARLQQFLPIARAAWPGSPCAGRENVHLAGDPALRAQAPAIAGPGESLNGMAEPDSCEVWLASGMTARTFCAVLVHELGHLAGREHTTTPGDVMNGEGDIDWPACDRATQPSATEQVEEELRSVLPAPRAAWRVTCGPKRGSERRCVARRGRSVRHYEVTETPTTVTVARDD